MAAGFREGLVEADGFRIRHMKAGEEPALARVDRLLSALSRGQPRTQRVLLPLLATVAALIVPLAGERQPKTGAQGGRQTTARWSVTGDCRGSSKDFRRTTWERTWIASGNISETLYCRWIMQMDQNGGW